MNQYILSQYVQGQTSLERSAAVELKLKRMFPQFWRSVVDDAKQPPKRSGRRKWISGASLPPDWMVAGLQPRLMVERHEPSRDEIRADGGNLNRTRGVGTANEDAALQTEVPPK